MKQRIYLRNPLHVRIPEAIDEMLKSILKDEEFRCRHKTYSKSALIRKAIFEFCHDYESDRLMTQTKDDCREICFK